MRRRASAIGLALVAAVAAPASAQAPASAEGLVRPLSVAEADRNGDGAIDRGELVAFAVRGGTPSSRSALAAAALRFFRDADTNGDERLSANEVFVSTL